MQELSVVVPCFNEEETLPLFIEEVEKISEEMEVETIYYFVNDGSTDQTLNVLRELAQENTRIRYLSFSRNFGKESALLAGLKAAKGEFVTVMDADLHDPPHLLPEMLRLICEENYDVVGTMRLGRKGEPPIRSWFAEAFYKLINNISDTKMVDGARDFRLMTRQVVDAILELKEVNRFSKGLFSWVGFKTTYLSFENRKRIAGETSWSFWNLFKYSLEGIINFSEAPLNIATFIGVISCLISFFAMLFYFIRDFFWDNPVSGWTSTACIILFIGGLQLFCLGIIGKYLGKVFLEVKKRPVYLIKEKNFD
ncbi:MAG: glycosyltransferase family 2 protein [Streptococcaceae bacterium]|jgi:glycosyltransferase involved in cell wall biosynthesis|nr:glycosyltransferase family 2 protein [Streptococcaceae bacterium]